jgi:hypothetical protein
MVEGESKSRVLIIGATGGENGDGAGPAVILLTPWCSFKDMERVKGEVRCAASGGGEFCAEGVGGDGDRDEDDGYERGIDADRCDGGRIGLTGTGGRAGGARMSAPLTSELPIIFLIASRSNPARSGRSCEPDSAGVGGAAAAFSAGG